MNLLQRLAQLLKPIEQPEPTERSLLFEQVSQQVEVWTYEKPGRPHFITFYLEQGQLYGLFNSAGQLSRAALDLDSDGQTIMVGDMEPVIHEFTPIARSGFYTVRQADGRTRFFMIAGTAIINRLGEIDSTKLYDDMIQRADETGFYPRLDFYHLGGVDPQFEFGQFDYLSRDGVVYVGSGLFDDGHPLTRATERALKRGGETWGASIEYYRPQNRGIEYVDLGNGLEIAAYTEGLNTRISLLPEQAAAAWYTSMFMEKRNMDERKLKALRDLFGDDEKGYTAFVANLTNVNKEVRDQGLVFRSADGAVEQPQAEQPAATDTPATDDTVVELDDAAVEAIVRIARTQLDSEVLNAVAVLRVAVTETLARLMEGQTTLLASLSGMQERVATLEQGDEEKQRTWLGDLPAKVQGQTRVTYRPRVERAETALPRTSADQATTVLNGLPKVGFNL